MPSVCLITVVSGPSFYRRMARKFFATAADHFHPTKDVAFRILNGREGLWPTGTMYRHHSVLEAAESHELDGYDHLFLADADMRCVGPIGPEILGGGITATQHPGYVGLPVDLLPYERRPGSECYVPLSHGVRYYAGGFIGGQRDAYLRMAEGVAGMIDRDVARGVVPQWHDESAVNRYLAGHEPAVVLDPRFCCPEDSSWYRSALWRTDYSADARIVALDKSPEQRQGR